MKKLFLLIIFIALIQDSGAFEIKPIGFNSEKWIGEQMPPYKGDEQSDSCDGGVSGTWYKAFSAYPIHEIITVTAAKTYCNSDNYNNSKSERNNNIFTLECDYISGRTNRSSSNSPIVSGSFFNDDPTGRIRDEGYGFIEILRGVIEFGSTINDKNSITFASHNGENQFLHSMKSPGEEDLDSTRARIVEYIAENFNLARYINEQLYSQDKSSIDRLKNLLDKPISHDSKYGFS